MKIKRFMCGSLMADGYVIWNRPQGHCMIIDPGYEPRGYVDFVQKENLHPTKILLTHHHYDHTGAAEAVADALGGEICMHEADAAVYRGRVDQTLRDGDVLDLDGEKILVQSTPGHTKGSVCFYSEKSRVCFTGDTVFDTDLGRCDLAGGSYEDMVHSIRTVADRWENDVMIYPGHEGNCTMKMVRQYNKEFNDCLPAPEDIRMVALDLDGTALTSSREFSPRTVRAFRAAMEQGVHIVISTGRVWNSLPECMFRIDGLEYVITSNGARVTHMPDEEILLEKTIPADAVEQVIGLIRGRGFSVDGFTEGKAYIDASEYEDMEKNGSDFRTVDYVLSTRYPVEGLLDFILLRREKIENISIVLRTPEERDRLMRELTDIPNITLTSSFDYNIEIGDRTTSKAAALKFLMKRLGIHKSQLMACGDSENDLAMMRLAGLGVAVANASRHVQEQADYVTDTNDRDGVAKAIERFVLK